MQTKTYGNTSYVETDREYVFNHNAETGNTLTVTYEVPEGNALASLPALGSSSSVMADVVLKKITAKPGIAGITSIKLDYGKLDPEDVESDDSDDDEESEGALLECSMDGSVNDEPLLSHPKAQNGISDAQREYLKAVQDGTRTWELVNELKSDGSPKVDKDGQPVMKPLKQLLTGLGPNGQAVLTMLQQGIHSYRSPGATYREVRLVGNSAVSLDGLGKIGSPSGAPSTGSRNWLMVGKSFSRSTTSTKKWQVETLYELSGEGGWNSNLYS